MIVGAIKRVDQKCCFSFGGNSSVVAVVMRLRHMHFPAHPPDCWHPCRVRAAVHFQRQDIQSRRQLASPSEPFRTHVLHALRLHGGPCSTSVPNIYMRKISPVKVCLHSVWIYIVFFAERPREMQHNQVSCFVVWEPGSRASAVLSKMHRSALRCLIKRERK